MNNVYLAGAWQTATSSMAAAPNVLITFDDGTLGFIDGNGPPITSSSNEAWSDSTNPDERGLIFQVPWDCKIDGFWMVGAPSAGATGDFTLALYSSPTGTPAAMASVAVLAEQMGTAVADRPAFFVLPSEVSLSRNTDYILAMRATGAGNCRLRTSVLGNTAYRVFLPGGTTLAKGTRDNGSGAFTAESPAVTMYIMGVRISSLDDGTGSGGGGGLLAHPGMRGGFI
jgi:hypothetical protein